MAEHGNPLVDILPVDNADTGAQTPGAEATVDTNAVQPPETPVAGGTANNDTVCGCCVLRSNVITIFCHYYDRL